MKTAKDSLGWMPPWHQFWFASSHAALPARIRGGICLIAIAYFASCFSDLAFWYIDGPLSGNRFASFLKLGELDDAARWIVSPLFLTDSLLVYQLYLLVGIVMAVVVAAGKGGRVCAVMLWLLFVGWANRSTFLAGVSESLISLGLFAGTIAVPQAAWARSSPASANSEDLRSENLAPGKPTSWTNTLALRLWATQISVVIIATVATMLAGRVWINGLGAYALVAPAMDRAIDWTVFGSPMLNTWVHESLTHYLVWALPVGLVLAWTLGDGRLGRRLLWAWCLIVAILGSHFLYAASFALMVAAIRPITPRWYTDVND